MTWTCPTCERRYPDSGIGVPTSHDADEMEGCEICWISPAGTARFVRPDSIDDLTDGGIDR